jgi:hypothetical protein
MKSTILPFLEISPLKPLPVFFIYNLHGSKDMNEIEDFYYNCAVSIRIIGIRYEHHNRSSGHGDRLNLALSGRI